MEKSDSPTNTKASLPDSPLEHGNDDTEMINASGHRQELERNFGLISICSLAITTGNTWIALGGSLVVAIYNGGPPGVIYELIVVSVFYWFMTASIAELASAVPSAGGVYHWAAITAGRYGRICGFFAGWWNFFAWIFGLAASNYIIGAQTVSMYAVMHPNFVAQRWQVFVAYIIVTWLCCGICCFLNRLLPKIEALGGFFILAGVLVTITVCAVMPHVNGQPYATNDFVWSDWENNTGYSSNGFCFILGMLNGAFSVGTPDVTSHLAEEIPRPSINILKAMLAQYVIGFLTALFYLIAIFYSISNLDAILTQSYLSLWRPSLLDTRPRQRDPFSHFFRRVDDRFKVPINSLVLCAIVTTVLGCIYLGSSTAFNAFVGSFVILTTLSYLAAILPHLLSRRANVTPGWFWMKGAVGYIVNAITCAYIIVFIVIFCFPFAMPVNATTMNYACLITGGLTIFQAVFWMFLQKDYVGPKLVQIDPLAEEVMVSPETKGP